MANNVRTQTQLKPPSKKTIVIVAVIGFLILFGGSFKSIASFFVDKMLFSALGQSDTFSRLLSARYFIPSIAFVIMTLVCALLIFLISKSSKKVGGRVTTDEFMEIPSTVFRKRPNLIRNLASLLVGMFFASSTYGYYKEWILFRNGSNTGIKEETFHKDIAFYLFKLPFIQAMLSWAFAAMVILFIVSVVFLMITGGLRLESAKRHISTYGRIHLSIILFLATLVKAAQYYFDKYSLVHSTRGAIDGATYTDVNAQIPALRLMMFVAIIAAVLFLVNVFRKGIVLPLVAIGLWLIVGLVVGTAYPAIIQKFVVQPSRNTKEKPYTAKNIKATKAAYGIDKIDSVDVNFEQDITAEDAQAIKTALANTQLFDENSAAPYVQQKRGEQYYEFTNMDRDRYTVDGKTFPSLISARELLPSSQLPDKSWQSIHSIYTHGFGAAALNSSNVMTDSTPDYLVADLPDAKASDKTDVVEPVANNLSLDTSKARVYFGEGLNQFAFIGSEKEQSPTSDKFDIDESSGVKVDSFLKKAIFALHYSDYNIMISDVVGSKTKIIYDRNPQERVKLLAPFLDIDSDPYPVITNNEVVWVVDAYTSTDQYPNSQYLDTDKLDVSNSLSKNINYVRNSVKATVNARTGKVQLYIVDSKDPLIKAYAKAFPKLFKDVKDAPKDIVDHFRYPKDIFDVQSSVLSDYHVDDETVLLKSSQKWQVAPEVVGAGFASDDSVALNTTSQTAATIANTASGGRADKTKATGNALPPLYQYMNHTSMDKPEFLLTRSFTPLSSTFQMDSYLSASSDTGSYGKLRLLNFDSKGDQSALSPSQMVGQINSDEAFSRNRTLLGQQGSKIVPGPLQMIPVANTVVYIQPQFVKGDSKDSRPVLTYVTVSIAGKTVCAPSISEAIDQLVAGTEGCVPFAAVTKAATPVDDGDSGSGDSNTTTTTTKPSNNTATSDLSKLSDLELTNKFIEARQAYDKAKNPLDLGALQKAADQMASYVDELQRRNK